jgi:hypothetical protein
MPPNKPPLSLNAHNIASLDDVKRETAHRKPMGTSKRWRYNSQMPIPPINLDCAELEDDELNALSDFLSSHPAVRTFITSAMVDSETPDIIEENSPLIVRVSPFVKNWNRVTQGMTGTEANILAGTWFAGELQAWCESRHLFAEYDPHHNLIPIKP